MTLPGDTYPLQFTKATIVDKSEIYSDHNCVRWHITSQPLGSLTYEEKIDRCKFKPFILNYPKVYQEILRQIYGIINPGSNLCPKADLEQEIRKVDEHLYAEQAVQVPNPIDIFSKIIRTIKIAQIEFENEHAIARNFRVRKLKMKLIRCTEFINPP